MTIKNVLFLCTGNSCRSIIAEALFNHLSPQGMQAESAGSQPTGQVHPRSLALLKRKGIPFEGYYSKSWDEITMKPDLVVTVCNNAAGEACPAFLGDVERLHWDIPDPAKATGTEAEINAAFEAVYADLRSRIDNLLSAYGAKA
jgi:arsenate reductase (thioredoxin)